MHERPLHTANELFTRALRICIIIQNCHPALLSMPRCMRVGTRQEWRGGHTTDRATTTPDWNTIGAIPIDRVSAPKRYRKAVRFQILQSFRVCDLSVDCSTPDDLIKIRPYIRPTECAKFNGNGLNWGEDAIPMGPSRRQKDVSHRWNGRKQSRIQATVAVI